MVSQMIQLHKDLGKYTIYVLYLGNDLVGEMGHFLI